MATKREPRSKIPRKFITPEYLKTIFLYDPKTGKLTRRKNNKKAGFVASNGYLYVVVGGNWLLVHRVAWAIVTNNWPSRKIDHRDRNKTNNRLCNIRQASDSENCANKCKSTNNTSGYKGVSFHAQDKLWRAQIVFYGKYFSIGLFKTAEEAYAAYCEAAKKIHGDFASFG